MKDVLRASALFTALVCFNSYGETNTNEETIADEITSSQSAPSTESTATSRGKNRFKRRGKGDRAETVDLSELNKTSYGTERAKPEDKAFRLYFDLALASRPGSGQNTYGLTFANFHSYVFLDVFPQRNVQFSFDISSSRGSPSFFELDWQAHPMFQLRLGKIWIPFDDLTPHGIFGGRVNVSLLAPGGTQFLPNLWTDLGVAVKSSLIDTTQLAVDAFGFVVNGFSGGGSGSPFAGEDYPNFGDTTLADVDNNRAKSFGGRFHMLVSGRFGLGGSIYHGRWNDQDLAEPHNITVFGADTQFKLKTAEIRAGAIGMKFDVDNDSVTRGGFYGEVGVNINDWKVIGRGGTLQLDDRVRTVTDQTIVGGTILYRLDFMQLSLEHSRDIKEFAGKTGTTFTAIRSILEL